MVILRGPHELNAYIIDLLSSRTDDNQNVNLKSSLSTAIDVARWSIATKIITAHADKASLVFAGSAETNHSLQDKEGYENTKLQLRMGAAWNVLLSSLGRVMEEDSAAKSDLFSAIVVASDDLEKYIATAKGVSSEVVKKIVVLTDGRHCCFDQQEDGTAVKAYLKENNFDLQVIYVGSHELYSTEIQQGKASNQGLRDLLGFVAEVEGDCIDSMEVYETFKDNNKVKQVVPSTKCRVSLNFGNKLKVPVYIYLGTHQEVFPTAKYECIYDDKDQDYTSEFQQQNNDDEPTVAVMARSAYTKTSNPDATGQMQEVAVHDLTKAYIYGKSLIPISNIERNLVEFGECEKCMDVLGSVDEVKSGMFFLHKPSELVVPDPSKPLGLATVAEALRKSSRRLICAYRWRKNVPTRLVMLSPPPAGQEFLVLNYLPTGDDTKPQIIKPILPSPSRQQKDVMNRLVATMSLVILKADPGENENTEKKEFLGIGSCPDESCEASIFDKEVQPLSQMNVQDPGQESESVTKEHLKLDEVYSPALQLFYYYLQTRLVNGNNSPLGAAPENFRKTLLIPESVLNSRNGLVESVKDLFPLEPVRTKKLEKEEQWKAIKNITHQQELDITSILDSEAPSDAENEGVDDIKVSVENCVESFAAILAEGVETKAKRAFKEMQDIIVDLCIETLHNPHALKKCLESLRIYKQGTIPVFKSFERYNELLNTLKDIILMNRKGFVDFAKALMSDDSIKPEIANGWDESRVIGLLESINNVSVWNQKVNTQSTQAPSSQPLTSSDIAYDELD